ncbi:MAG: MoaD/ThiS family protein [Gammaproteobacteria bacterium]
MTVTFKLYASLGQYLPAGAADNQLQLDVSDGTTVLELIDRYSVPRELAFLVMINGVFIKPEDRDTQTFTDGDTLAIWPPVAGG